MIPAITIRNLPQKITEPLLEDILNAHQVQSREIILQPQEPVATEPLQQAHVMLRKREAIPHALRILNQNEVGDQILQAIEATEEAQQQFQQLIDQREMERKRRERESLFTHFIQYNRDSDSEEEVIIPFSKLGLSETTMNNLKRLEFETTTPIQALAIPPAMEGCDMIARAQTGTGKTLAFVIPIVERLLARPTRGVRALLLAPTRELAIQIREVVEGLLPGTGLRSIVIYGGEHILDQVAQLFTGAEIIIATPGRLLDLQGRGKLRFDAAEILVLDEADRMLDMGFMPQIQNIVRCFYSHPQTLLFSATIPDEIKKLSKNILKDPVLVEVGEPDLSPLESISQEILYVTPHEKDQALYELLDHEPGTIIVFVSTKRMAEQLSQRLKYDGYPATRIHGDIEQVDRIKAVEKFRSGECRILVATDVAARGLDIENVAHVINYDLPQVPEDHLHRIGRTARAGTKGKATTFVTHQEKKTLGPFRGVLGQK
ncbi:MAG: DEAD/DEAH box helicase [bacterium]|jgi:superfamily II DNA/RNA helicase